MSLFTSCTLRGTDGCIDNPLMVSFMDQQNNKLLPRHASLMYTHSPSCDTLPLKKAVDKPFKSKRAHGPLVRGKRRDHKDNLFWDNAENASHDNWELYSEQIPTLSFPTEYQADQSAFDRAEIVQLQCVIEQLEGKLQERESQLQAVENNTQQIDVTQLQKDVAELQKQISIVELKVQAAHHQLLSKEDEVTVLHSLVRKAEAEVEASHVKLDQVQEKLQSLARQVAVFMIHMHSIALRFSHDEEEAFYEVDCEIPPAPLDMEIKAEGNSASAPQYDCRVQHVFDSQIELTRRKYLGALVAARENPAEELLLLVAELRAQLQVYVMNT